MKSIALYLSLTMALGSVVGCKSVKVENGIVPEKYMAQAELFTGTYQGSFNGVEGALLVNFKDRMAIVQFVGDTSPDLVGVECESKIGKLKKFQLRRANGERHITKAVFEFFPNRCSRSVDGRELELKIEYEDNRIIAKARILEDVEYHQDRWCSGYNSYNHSLYYRVHRHPYYFHPHFDGWFYCDGSFYRSYLKGEFSRKLSEGLHR